MNAQLQFGLIVIVLLGLIMLSTTYSCSNFKAFSNGSKFFNEAKYEGFEANSGKSVNNPSEVAATPKPEEEEEESNEDNVEPFQGLQPSEINKTNDVVDNIGNGASGSPQCSVRSSGLSNDKGPLCLSDSQIQLLKTRGGNSAGRSDMQVQAYSGK